MISRPLGSLIVLVLIVFPSHSFSQSAREYIQWKKWCRSIGGTVTGDANNPICIPPASIPTPVVTPSAEELLKRQQELLRREKEQKAVEADQKGVQAAKRGNWEEALNFFLDALSFAPDNQAIRSHLLQAQAAVTDTQSAEKMRALRQRVEDSLAAADLEAFRGKMEEKIAVRQMTMMNNRFSRLNDLTPNSTPEVINQKEVEKINYPFSRQPISSNSPPGRVLEKNQDKIKALDQEIRQARQALRNLIKLNATSEVERLEWTKQSEEATISAQDLAISLVLDLAEVHLKQKIKISDKERSQVLDRVLSRREGEQGSQVAYGILVNRKNELINLQKLVGLAKKENDLRIKIRDLSMKNTKITLEDFWDVFNQFEVVDELAGPSKNLVDAAYTIYKQAASLEVLAITQRNQENIYKAADKLQEHILKLVAQKKKLSSAITPLKQK